MEIDKTEYLKNREAGKVEQLVRARIHTTLEKMKERIEEIQKKITMRDQT